MFCSIIIHQLPNHDCVGHVDARSLIQKSEKVILSFLAQASTIVFPQQKVDPSSATAAWGRNYVFYKFPDQRGRSEPSLVVDKKLFNKTHMKPLLQVDSNLAYVVELALIGVP